MKILICAHDATITGGANRSLLMIIDRLRGDYGVEIEVLVPRNKGSFNDALTKRGIKWYGYLFFGVTSSIRNDQRDWMRILKVYGGYFLESYLAKYLYFKLKNKKYDLVYTNTRGPIVGAKLAKILKCPSIVHVREFGAEIPLFGFWGYKPMYKMSNRIILISHALYEEYKKYIPSDKLVEIPNGIDSRLDLPFHQHGISEEFNLLITGRLVPDKGHKDAILALKKLVDSGYKNIHLYIAGSLQASMHIDWYKDELNSLINNYNLGEYIIFCGEVSDMDTLRAKMDVELMCAIKETFGRVTVEGMRSGLILIGSNTGGTIELIRDGETGLLYQQGDANDLAEKIETVYADRNFGERLAKAGYEYSRKHFTPEENIRKIYGVIEDVINSEV